MNRKSVFALQAFLLLLAATTARADVWYESGKRHILTDVEYAAEVADAREKTRVLCSQ